MMLHAAATPLRRVARSMMMAGTTMTTTRYYSSSTPRLEIDKIDSKLIDKINSNLTDEEAEAIIQEELEMMEAKKVVKKWKPGERKRELTMSYHLEDFEYDLDPNAPPRWTLRDKRCGALGIKLGMIPVWDDWGERHPCTVLFLDSNVILGHKTTDQHGYVAVQVAGGERKKKNVIQSVMGQYKPVEGMDEHPPYLVREFRVSDEGNLPPVGSRIHARHFVPGQNVDVSGTSKGKGFQGAMKRHGFSGMPASHGTSLSHRALGSTGQCQDPGKVFKGKKMAGRMGADRVTVQNLRIIKIDRGRNLLYVRGAIPGNKGEFVEIKDSVKKPLFGTPKIVDELKVPPLPSFQYDEAIDGCGEPGHEEFMPLPQRDPFSPDESEAA